MVLLFSCGKKPKVGLKDIVVGAVSVGMDESAVPARFNCKWEVFASSKVRGPTGFVCADGEMLLDFTPFGQPGAALATVRLYKKPRSNVVSGFSVSFQPPLTISAGDLASTMAKHYEGVIGVPPLVKGKTYNWKVQGVTFFIHIEEENRRVVVATLPAF